MHRPEVVNNFRLNPIDFMRAIVSGEATSTGPSTGCETFEPERQDNVLRGLTPSMESLHVSG